jgi:hypothetical protein
MYTRETTVFDIPLFPLIRDLPLTLPQSQNIHDATTSSERLFDNGDLDYKFSLVLPLSCERSDCPVSLSIIDVGVAQTPFLSSLFAWFYRTVLLSRLASSQIDT